MLGKIIPARQYAMIRCMCIFVSKACCNIICSIFSTTVFASSHLIKVGKSETIEKQKKNDNTVKYAIEKYYWIIEIHQQEMLFAITIGIWYTQTWKDIPRFRIRHVFSKRADPIDTVSVIIICITLFIIRWIWGMLLQLLLSLLLLLLCSCSGSCLIQLILLGGRGCLLLLGRLLLCLMQRS